MLIHIVIGVLFGLGCWTVGYQYGSSCARRRASIHYWYRLEVTVQALERAREHLKVCDRDPELCGYVDTILKLEGIRQEREGTLS